jgi:hypothetical protein
VCVCVCVCVCVWITHWAYSRQASSDSELDQCKHFMNVGENMRIMLPPRIVRINKHFDKA